MTSHAFTDSNVFIYAATNNPRQEQAAKKVRAGTHTDALVLLETYAKIRTITGDEKHARRTIRQILRTYHIAPVDESTVFDATKIDDLDIFDAVHLVCADGKPIHTYDDALKQRSAQPTDR